MNDVIIKFKNFLTNLPSNVMYSIRFTILSFLWFFIFPIIVSEIWFLIMGEERNDPLYYRLFKSFLRGSYEGSINAPKLNLVDSETILKITRRVVEHAAEKGNCVIVGRGSQQFLKNRPNTLRIFLYAPREDKVRRLLGRGKSEKDAHELVDTVDRERADFIQKYFNSEWPDRPIYHSMLNTAIGDECVANMILSLVQTYEARCAP